jgi:hypothetical protein
MNSAAVFVKACMIHISVQLIWTCRVVLDRCTYIQLGNYRLSDSSKSSAVLTIGRPRLPQPLGDEAVDDGWMD